MKTVTPIPTVTFAKAAQALTSFNAFVAEDVKRNFSIPGARIEIVRNIVAARKADTEFNEAVVAIMKTHKVVPSAEGAYRATPENCKTYPQLREEIELTRKKDSKIVWEVVKYSDLRNSEISAGILTDWVELGIVDPSQ